MLSQSNIDKLNMHGLYRHKPDRSMRSPMFYNDMYHCMNWTFYPVCDINGKYHMVDTYFQNRSFDLDDNNFEEYEFVFDRTKVRKVPGFEEAELYDKYYCVADDSGGIRYPHYYVDSDACKSNIKVIESLEREISSLENELRYKKYLLEQERNKCQLEERNSS